MSTVIDLENITVEFNQDGKSTKAVDNVSISINKGDIYGIVGYSGAGKSTLVRVINLLQNPTSGKVIVNGFTLFDKSKSNSAVISNNDLQKKRRKIGMIFQHFNLLEELTVSQNIEFALKHSNLNGSEIKERVAELLSLVGMDDKENAFPAQLSGGQQQRVSIARALANNPEIIISDEATSALDPNNTKQILDLLSKLNKELGVTVVLITHEMEAVKRIADKISVMSDGKVIESGDIVHMFTNPHNDLTKELIGFNNEIETAFKLLKTSQITSDKNNWDFLHLSYIGDSLFKPIATDLYKNFQVDFDVIYSSVSDIQGTPIGSIFAVITGEDSKRNDALKFINQSKIKVNILNKERAVLK